MSVPYLARDAPVTQIFDPVIIDAFESVGKYGDFSAAHWLEHEFLERFISARGDRLVYIDKPLQFRKRLDYRAGAFCGRNILQNFFFFFHQSFTAKPLGNNFASLCRFLSYESLVADGHFCVFIDDLLCR